MVAPRGPHLGQFVGIVTVEGLAGVEFYRNNIDAPLEFRSGGPPCLRAIDGSVLVLWRKG